MARTTMAILTDLDAEREAAKRHRALAQEAEDRAHRLLLELLAHRTDEPATAVNPTV